MSDRTVEAARALLAGERRGWRGYVAFAGPAVVASIAYMDPGNFATNIQAGARYGYQLLWVVLLANLIAMLFQALSAKLGIVTGKNLAELCRERFSPPVAIAMWIVSEIAAMATDLAEFLGGAIGLSLLLGMPLLWGMVVTAVIVYAILMCDRFGFRPVELIISSLVGVIGVCYLVEMFIAPVDWRAAALHTVLPQLPDSEALLLAVGIIGATVMPHVIYLHSALTSGRMACRNDRERSRVLRFERLDVIIALGLAGLVNMAMLAAAAKLFHTPALSGLSSIGEAHAQFGHLVGGTAALAFAVALLASGASSSSVGTYAGQVVMAGFINIRIPLLVRRAVTMIPAIVVLAIGVSPTSALVLSQVVLSFGIPFALVPLVMVTCRRDIMGVHVNRRLTTILAWGCASLISGLNVFLIYQQFFMG
jgi:manganese transport protein